MLRVTSHAVASSSRCTLNHFLRSRLAAESARIQCPTCARTTSPNNQPARALHSSPPQARTANTPSPPRAKASARPWQQKSNPRARLAAPTELLKIARPPNATETRDALLKEISAFTTSIRVAGRLVTLGVKGDAARALLLTAADRKKLSEDTLQRFKGKGREEGPSSIKFHQRISSELEHRVGEDDIKVIQALLPIWKQSAIASLAAASKAGSTSKNQGRSLSTGGTPEFAVAALRQASEVEGPMALQRACMHHFLDWLSDNLSKLSQESASPRRHSGKGEAHGDSTFSALSPIGHSASILLAHLSHLLRLTDYLLPAAKYPTARALNRQIHLHIGPTNSGKTYGALLALTKAETGMYAGPLRLLAHEVFERINEGSIGNVPPRPCNLLTGEEKRIVDPKAGLVACTVEMADFETEIDVAVIDEIQMIGDPARGSSWTAAVLGLPAKELHLCGEASALPLIRRLTALCNDELHIHTYQRLTPLRVADQSLGGDLSKIEKGDCIVTFARSNIFFLKRMIEQKTGLKCAVAYGALPPETRSEQARLFNDTSEKGFDVMVASDAIGMGLNLKIKRVIFEACTKWDGGSVVPLSTSQIKQIAGRAGRYGTQENVGDSEAKGGIVTTLNEDDLPYVHAALASGIVPIRRAGMHVLTPDISELAMLLSSIEKMDRQLGIDIWSNDELPSKNEDKEDKEDKEDEDEVDEDGDWDEELDEGRGKSRRRGGRKDRKSKKDSREEEEVKPLSVEDQKIDAILKAFQQGDLSNPKARPDWYDSARSISTLYSVVTQAIRFDPTLFFLPQYERTRGISNILEACGQGQLTFEEKDSIGKSPASLRDERVIVLLSGMVRGYARGELVRFDECAKGLEMLETLAEVEKAAKEKVAAANGQATEARKAVSKEKDDGEVDTKPARAINVGGGEANHPVLNLNSLVMLESLHRSLTLYLWLSYRFPLAFAFRNEARQTKLRTERAIEATLAATRFSHRKPAGTKGGLETSGTQGEKGDGGVKDSPLDAMQWTRGGGLESANGGSKAEEEVVEEDLIERWKSAMGSRGGDNNSSGHQPSQESDDGKHAEMTHEGEVKVILGEGAGGVIKDF
ncbi:hypothetical protein A4X09_0g3237 [Tilletia walkeri]|uniref:RNA helicase n=1 Tax=Tilletia walkeri TaxID=117179 RepID=A0A8X7N9D6_9BASI|nr:hypothetical protein A4X09_0g3237 [Tilletia walkeri]